MSEYNTKNYTEQGGEKTVIGGTLEIKEGASVTGLPLAANQPYSTASTVSGLKDSFNDLLTKLKDGGVMTPDAWNVTVAKIAQVPSGDPHAADMTANQAAVSSVSLADDVITVAVDLDALMAFLSSNPAQGTHKWVGIAIATGQPDITAVKYNGEFLTAADVNEAADCGGPAGTIVMWLKCDEISEARKKFTLWASGFGTDTFYVAVND